VDCAERLLVIAGVGIQLWSERMNKHCTNTFIPAGDVENVVIVEAFQRFRVVTTLIVTRRNGQDSVVAFPVSLLLHIFLVHLVNTNRSCFYQRISPSVFRN
jgi:GPI-GlcNAc transferase complex, PIG-H component